MPVKVWWDLPLLLPTVVSLPSRLWGGRASGCGCVEMSALSGMTTSVSKRTESSRGPLSLWHWCWGCHRRCGFVPAPEHVLCWCYWLLVGCVGMVTDFHVGCLCHLGCVWATDARAKKALFFILVFWVVASQLQIRSVSTHVSNSRCSYLELLLPDYFLLIALERWH